MSDPVANGPSNFIPMVDKNTFQNMGSTEGNFHRAIRGNIITSPSGIKVWHNPHIPPHLPQKV